MIPRKLTSLLQIPGQGGAFKLEKWPLSCLFHVPSIGHSGTKTVEISLGELQEESH